ncbi:MAG: putative competence-damage inducible protein [Planctomycetota bacterium]|jgi:nicotinamide-nucleotide amidase
MLAEVISIGDELTSGQRLDTNSQWLAERLGELGVTTLYHTTVGDDLAANVRVFREAVERADLIVATGGLGPTADDLTREAVAQTAGVELELDPASLDHIHKLFERRKRTMPPANRVQALFPRGSRVVPNPHGTAPGIDLSIPRPGRSDARIFCLPGVPAEMREMWTASVAPAIEVAFGPERQVIRHYRIKCFGVGESDLEQMLPDLIRRGRDPIVGITVSKATITLRITAVAESEAACRDKMAPTIATIHECLGELVFGEEDDELQHVVCRQLAAARATVASREAGTRGLLAWLLGEASTASFRPFVGGIVTTETMASGAADVGEWAEQARRQFTADYGLAVGPLDADDVDIAVASATGVERIRFARAGHPDIVVPRTAKQALNALRLVLRRRHDHTDRSR